MRKAAQKLLPGTFWLGVVVSVSSLLWLAIYYTVEPGDALLLGFTVLLCLVVQVAAWLAGKRYATARYWPAALMLAGAPATLWSSFAGPGALYDVGPGLLVTFQFDAVQPLAWLAYPLMMVGILVSIAWAVMGALVLAADVTEQRRQRQKAAARKARLAAFGITDQPEAVKAADTATAPETAETPAVAAAPGTATAETPETAEASDTGMVNVSSLADVPSMAEVPTEAPSVEAPPAEALPPLDEEPPVESLPAEKLPTEELPVEEPLAEEPAAATALPKENLLSEAPAAEEVPAEEKPRFKLPKLPRPKLTLLSKFRGGQPAEAEPAAEQPADTVPKMDETENTEQEAREW